MKKKEDGSFSLNLDLAADLALSIPLDEHVKFFSGGKDDSLKECFSQSDDTAFMKGLTGIALMEALVSQLPCKSSLLMIDDGKHSVIDVATGTTQKSLEKKRIARMNVLNGMLDFAESRLGGRSLGTRDGDPCVPIIKPIELDEDGKELKPPKKKRTPKLDEDGNEIPKTKKTKTKKADEPALTPLVDANGKKISKKINYDALNDFDIN